jgi:potassium-transporting ATPase KdpC subunit
MKSVLRPALVMLVVLSAITGLAYPLLVAGVGKAAFTSQSEGSLVFRDGKVVGSVLIGQPFADPKYFWGRLSATSPMPYNATSSSGSNVAPTNPALLDAAKGRLEALRATDPGNNAPVPVDLVTASGSGLDPHVSPRAAHYQAARVAKARGIDIARVEALIEANTEGPQWGIFGEARVNVLALNLGLDRAQ